MVEDGRTLAVVVRDGRAVPVDGYRDVGELLADGERGLEQARVAEGDMVLGELCAPVLQPGAVFCVGLNYATHITEMGRDLPSSPTLFSKLSRSLTGPVGGVALPQASHEVDYEAELVVVIGRAGRDIAPADAADHIAGYTLMNDVSMRDWQNRTLQWFAGKNFERSTPVGPVIVTPDELDLASAEIVCLVNGEERQRAPLADLVFDPVALVADISRMTTLQPGDLIATGTPGGVGHASKRYLSDGDVVEVTVDAIGTLRTTFVGA
jgi:acylpyruvate hydrolase